MSPAAPDIWAVEASSLPLAFAQVREDPRLDWELARTLPTGATVVMIASGGDTAACLGRLPLRLHMVDVNPAQLALSRLKWQLAGEATSDEAAGLLGHRPMPTAARQVALEQALERLSLDPGVFGPPDIVATLGPDHAGRYEIAFAEIRRRLEPWQTELDKLLSSATPVELESANGSSAELGKNPLSGATLSSALAAAFRDVMALPNLVGLFGQEATQNPRQPFAEHFIQRTRGVIARFAPNANPFLWQILAGCFPPDCCYDWYRTCGHPLSAEATWHREKMNVLLDTMPAESADLIHLSNILDWLSPEEAGATLRSARRVLSPGGKVILRQLNSTLDIPRLESGIRWDSELGNAMEASDRSYFYPQIHVGHRA